MKTYFNFRLFTAAALAMVTSSLLSCSSRATKPSNEATAKSESSTPEQVVLSTAQFRQSGIELGSFDHKILSEEVQATGTVDVPPQNFASVSAPLGGFVRYTDLLPGHFVKKGQVLAVLEHPDYIKLQQDYLQALSQLHFLEQEVKRQTELNEENVGAKRKLQESLASYQSTKALISSLEAQLNMLHMPLVRLRRGHISPTINLYAPISGYIKTANVNLGKLVNPTDVLFEIVNKEHIHLELKVFEKDAGKIKEGQRIHFTIPQMRNQESKAKVYLVNRVFEGESKTISVHGHIESEGVDLLPGSYVRAWILTGEQNTPALPEESVFREGNQSFVYALEQKKGDQYIFKKIPVKTGVLQDDFVAILPETGFSENQQIVKKGAYYLTAEFAKTSD